jgi:hypothetical protein
MGVVVLALVVALGVYGYSTYKPAPTSVSNIEDSTVRAVVEHFGSLMKNVSLLAPDASVQIQGQYAAYVAPELLAVWKANPESAPGRKTSSPWPEKINVVSIIPAGVGVYSVEANVVEFTNASGGPTPAAVYPTSMRVENRGGQWLISLWHEGAYSELPHSQTIVGFWECLPHKDTSGPQTTECAFGIAKDQSHGHYAVDTSLMSTYPVDYPTGTQVRITGIVTPANQLSSVQKYDIDGIISATSIEKI